MNGLVLDLIVIVFIAIVSFKYMKKGLLRSVFSFISFFAAFAISAIVRPVIIEILKNAEIITDKSDEIHLLVINIISYIVVSVIVIILFFIIGKTLDLFSSLPIIGFLNLIGGLLFGFLLAVTVCTFIFSIVSIVGEWVNIEKFMYLIENSFVSKFFYENNLFLLLQ